MHSTMQERLTSMIRGGLAVTLASTLMVPTTALAQAADDAASQMATVQGAQTTPVNSENPEANANANAGDNAADAASPTDEQVASLLAPMGGAADEAADAVLANNDATQADVDAATATLAAAYQGLAKANASSDNGGTTGDNGANGAATSGNANGDSNGNANGNASGAAASASGTLSQTGDMAPVAPIAGGGLIAALGAIVSAAALRLRKRSQR